LIFDILILKLMRIIASGVSNFGTNFGVSVPLLLDLWANTSHTHHVTLLP